jgi:MFS family permease
MGVAFICVLFSVGSIHPLVMSQARGIVPSRLLGRALGLLNSLVFLGIAISSSCFGWIAGGARLMRDPPAHLYGLLFSFTACPLVIAAVVYVFSPRTVSHDTHA